MSRAHTYSSEAKEDSVALIKAGGCLAAICYVVNRMWADLPAQDTTESCRPLAAPLTVGILAPILYWCYNKYLWKVLSGLPDLNGTWIGMGQPNYRPIGSPHLHVTRIVQTRSTIHICSDTYFISNPTDSWKNQKEYVGTDDSKSVYISELSGRDTRLEFNNTHKGNGSTQLDFESTVLLRITVSEWQISLFRRVARLFGYAASKDLCTGEGHYFTNRFYPENQSQRGSWGHFYYRQVSHTLLSSDEALELVEANVLNEIRNRLQALSPNHGLREQDSNGTEGGNPKDPKITQEHK